MKLACVTCLSRNLANLCDLSLLLEPPNLAGSGAFPKITVRPYLSHRVSAWEVQNSGRREFCDILYRDMGTTITQHRLLPFTVPVRKQILATI